MGFPVSWGTGVACAECGIGFIRITVVATFGRRGLRHFRAAVPGSSSRASLVPVLLSFKFLHAAKTPPSPPNPSTVGTRETLAEGNKLIDECTASFQDVKVGSFPQPQGLVAKCLFT
eukprot:scaffold5147_cov20-Tisochrysis_lutea.AAC.3